MISEERALGHVTRDWMLGDTTGKSLVQRGTTVSGNGTTTGIEQPSKMKADPVLPRSAANGFDSGAAPNLRLVVLDSHPAHHFPSAFLNMKMQ
jgi:hypothetical protein